MRSKPYTLTAVEDSAPPAAKPMSIDNFDSSVQAVPVLWTGWASYRDTQYTSAAPFNVAGGPDGVMLPNNAATVLDSQIPTDIASFYDPATKKIAGRTGDGMIIVIDLTLRPLSGSLTSFELWVDIGGAIGRTYQNSISVTKGNGVAHRYSITLPVYTLDTWEANGGVVYVQAAHECEIFDIRYIFHRTHKAR
jgi:hypothetical protein